MLRSGYEKPPLFSFDKIPLMMRFSERYGHTPVRSALQVDDVDDGLRNRLWNLVRTQFFSSAPPFAHIPTNSLSTQRHVQEIFENLWHNYFKQPTDIIGNSYLDALASLKSYFMDCKWYRVYDLLEFFANNVASSFRVQFVNTMNAILKQEMSGYRFVSGQIVQITSEEEIAAIEQATSLGDSLKTVKEHLRQALTLLSDRQNPDYRNSIKESISAIESLSKIISGMDKATLGPALNAVEKAAKLHPSLKEAFQKLYGYTNDGQGIRHALMDEPTLDFEDAKFMLVSCSAFVNYLVVKAQKAGIKI